jgi:Ser/Thr protein kinase RdoA (MazF antagonist)
MAPQWQGAPPSARQLTVDLSPEVVAAVSEAVGVEVRPRGRPPLGESAAAFLVDSAAGAFVVKLGAPGTIERQRRRQRLVAGLRARGYPAPDCIAVGAAAGVVFVVHEWLPGAPLADFTLVPDLLDAIDLQQGAGEPGDPAWPGELIETIERGGDGYCLHQTMREHRDTSRLLDELIGIAVANAVGPVAADDAVHFDLNPANVLEADGRLAGVVDWSSATSGDRGFDVATLLFYAYDDERWRERLWERAIAISGLRWTAVYLCHLVLRQVEWSRRHHPRSADDRRHVGIGAAVLEDLRVRCGT